MVKLKGGSETKEAAMIYFNLFKIKMAQNSLTAGEVYI